MHATKLQQHAVERVGIIVRILFHVHASNQGNGTCFLKPITSASAQTQRRVSLKKECSYSVHENLQHKHHNSIDDFMRILVERCLIYQCDARKSVAWIQKTQQETFAAQIVLMRVHGIEDLHQKIINC